MSFTVGDVARVLWEVHHDLLISYEVAKEIFDMTHEARYKQFPWELERHAASEEAKYRMKHPDACLGDLMGVRQEYLTAEIVELAGNAARDRRKHEVESEDVSVAIRNDPELNALFLDKAHDVLGIVSSLQCKLDHLLKEHPSPLSEDDIPDVRLKLSNIIDNTLQQLKKGGDSL